MAHQQMKLIVTVAGECQRRLGHWLPMVSRRLPRNSIRINRQQGGPVSFGPGLHLAPPGNSHQSGLIACLPRPAAGQKHPLP